MIASLKAELRKIWTVRSTYIILLFSIVLMGFFAFWTEGIKAGDSGKAVTDPYKLATLIRDAVSNLAFFGGLAGILSMANEYRYNTIMYTLAASRSRSQTLLAKVVAITIFSVLFTLFVPLFATMLMYLGLGIKGLSLTHQIIPGDLIWRVLFVGWSYGMLGLLLAALIRQQVGAIAAYFVLPGIVEQLIGLLLKDNKIYLPFAALQQVTTTEGIHSLHFLSHAKAAAVFSIYLIVGWAVAWILFLRRDAA
jgi:ABC-2 type transport system permease protein